MCAHILIPSLASSMTLDSLVEPSKSLLTTYLVLGAASGVTTHL